MKRRALDVLQGISYRPHIQVSSIESESGDYLPKQISPIDSPTDDSKKRRTPGAFYNGCAVFLLCIAAAFFILARSSSSSLLSRNSTAFPHASAGREAMQDDPTLGGLISPLADNRQCVSRGLIHRFRKASQYMPSGYLVSRLRRYEALHKRCAPGTENYKSSLRVLSGGGKGNVTTECKYIVWIAYSGLGNRIISIAAAFVYALLTDRVLLVDGQASISDLFCEPFPDTTWLLPSDFPISSQFYSYNETSSLRLGHLLETRSIQSNSPSLYIHLTHSYDFHDKLVFCEREQGILSGVPWLFMRTNQYFVPFLYIYLPNFREELERLFPEREAVFHHIGRYLFSPTDSVWGWIYRFYRSYLAGATERIGLQIRIFELGSRSLEDVSEQVLACAIGNKILPNVSDIDTDTDTNSPRLLSSSVLPKSLAILITSLKDNYFIHIRDFFLEKPSVSGELISVYQPSHESFQQTNSLSHNKKAWAEICLLSFSDRLVTSSWSTFGYAAQGLAGIRPWVLTKVENDTMPDAPVCTESKSMDPCFHAPPYYDCQSGIGTDTSVLLPYVQHCEDVSWGLKLFNNAPI